MTDGTFDYPPAADRAGRLLRRRRGWPWWVWASLLIVLLLAAGAGILWFAYTGAERQAAETVRQLGGRVRWADDRPGDGHVLSVSFQNVAGFKDDDLTKLTPWWWHFPGLQELDLSGTAITDEGLAHVRGAGVRNLVLRRTQITTAGLRHLAGNTQLRSLSLTETQVGDEGLTYLRGLPHLGNLYLRGTRVSDDGLEHLSGLKSLRYLQLGDNAGVTEAGVEKLKAALPKLRVTH